MKNKTAVIQTTANKTITNRGIHYCWDNAFSLSRKKGYAPVTFRWPYTTGNRLFNGIGYLIVIINDITLANIGTNDTYTNEYVTRPLQSPKHLVKERTTTIRTTRALRSKGRYTNYGFRYRTLYRTTATKTDLHSVVTYNNMNPEYKSRCTAYVTNSDDFICLGLLSPVKPSIKKAKVSEANAVIRSTIAIL